MNFNKQAGLSLIEQILVIMIIGIIASIAWSSFDNQRIKANRTDAMTALMKVANEMERCYQKAIPNSYESCAIPADSGGTLCFKVINITCPLSVGSAPTQKGLYTISVSGQTTSNYMLTATPIAGGLQDGDDVFTLDAKGNKSGPWPK